MLYKNILVKIRKSFGRYISLLIIVLVGVGFCSGIMATSSDIVKTADNYYKKNNLMNFKIVSTLGLTDDDVNDLKNLKNIGEVIPSYSLDVLEDGKPIRVHAIEDSVNTVNLVSGRMPKYDYECVADSKNFKPGDKINITSNESDKLKNNVFNVVGTISSVLYLNDDYGSTNIGDGKLSSFIFVNKSSFTIDAYTEIYVKASWNEGTLAYSKQYDDLSSEINDEIVNIKSERETARYSEIYNKANDEIIKNEAKLNDEKAKGEKELADAKMTLDDNQASLNSAKDQIAQNEAMLQMANMTDPSLDAAKFELLENEEKLNKGYDEYNENLAKFNSEISDAQVKIDDAKKKVSEIEKPKWIIFTRESIPDYSILKTGTDTITSVAQVFPIFFMIIVMLMTSNTMARMIEEERNELGTLTSLGYGDNNIISTYLLYVLSASFLGVVAGFFIGCTVIPKIIFSCFSFDLPSFIIEYNLMTFIFILVFSLVVMVLVTFISCNRELKHKPATLLRPVPPKNGQRILLEKIAPIWKNLSFTWKITMRNMFRFKKRGVMTVIGVAGCTALLVAGFGLRDSNDGIAQKQYGSILKYDDFIVLKDETKTIDDSLKKTLNDNGIVDPVLIKQSTFKVDQDKKTMDFYMIVPESPDDFYKYYNLKSVETKDNIKLNENGVVITQKIAEFFKVKKGDSINVKDADNSPYTLTIADVTENYVLNYIYMNKDVYGKVFGKTPTYNAIVSKFNGDEKTLAENLISSDLVLNVVYTSDVLQKTVESNYNLNNVIIMIVVVASLLAIIVLYNLTSINISERKREIATLKVLGFNDKETNQYVYREAMILTFISIGVGIVLGIALHHFVVGFIEGADIVFMKNIKLISYVWAALITLVFSLIMQIVTYFKLKDIDMIGSLKSVE